MIKESGKMVRRSGERIWGMLEFLGEMGNRPLGMTTHLRAFRIGVTDGSERMLQALDLIPSGSPLDDVGPIPDELRKDPFPGDSVPWSIQEAEKEQGRSREMMIWKIAIAVSWSVTAVAALRSMGML